MGVVWVKAGGVPLLGVPENHTDRLNEESGMGVKIFANIPQNKPHVKVISRLKKIKIYKASSPNGVLLSKSSNTNTPSLSLSLQGVLKSWKKPRHFILSLLFLHLKPATTIEKNVRKSNWGILSPMFKVKMPKNRLIDHRLRTGGRLQTFVVRPQALLKPIINDLKNFVPNLHTPRIEDTPQTMSPAWIPKYQHGIWAWNKLTEGYVVGMWFVHEWYPPQQTKELYVQRKSSEIIPECLKSRKKTGLKWPNHPIWTITWYNETYQS